MVNIIGWTVFVMIVVRELWKLSTIDPRDPPHSKGPA